MPYSKNMNETTDLYGIGQKCAGLPQTHPLSAAVRDHWWQEKMAISAKEGY